MFKYSIDDKPIFERPDGEKVKDLTLTMLDLKNRNYTAYNVYKVPKEYVMRPDLIAKSVYNNSLYAEIILKFNGISNPFTIGEGDLILIPELESALDKLRPSTQGSDADAAKKIRDSYKYIDPLKRPKRSEEQKKFDEREISIPNNSLPPNINKEGQGQITRRGNRVYFGQNADTCIPDGVSSAEFLARLIKNKK